PAAPAKAPISPISARLSRRGATRSPLSAAVPEAARQPPTPPVAAARQALEEGSLDDAVRLSRELAAGTPAEARWGQLVEGQAHLERGDWAAAIPPLRAAAEAARADGEGETLGRALSSLGRALHHAGQFDDCRAALVEATRVWSPPPLDAAAILRLLGDLALRMGDVETAEERWTEAAQIARDHGSADAEARACRGLASCTTVRGHYAEALDQLNEALQLLDETADPRVVTALLARRLELESVLGRYARALETGERLLEITVDDPAGRAEALGLLAEVLSALGLADETIQAAGEVASLIEAIGPRPDPGIRAARALCEVGRPAEALSILDHLSSTDRSPMDDLRSQIDAVRARAMARSDSAAARDLANDVLTRPSPLLAIRAARIRLDAALALHEAGADSAARNAVKRGLKLVQGSGNKGLKLELLIAMYLASPDHRVVEAAARTAMRVLEDLPPHAAQTFRARPMIAAALARYREA
ncbi:MAG: tetratricopeptide repeat protein, partial [Myxococcota bacterium]